MPIQRAKNNTNSQDNLAQEQHPITTVLKQNGYPDALPTPLPGHSPLETPTTKKWNRRVMTRRDLHWCWSSMSRGSAKTSDKFAEGSA